MRIIFMGTPDFSVPALDALVEAGHEVMCVVAQPDKPKGRGKKLSSPPTIIRARELGIPTKQPRAVRRGPFVEWMKNSGADTAVVVAYGRILIPDLLQAPRLGCINIHASLLPSYRGAAPIHWAIINGEQETGVCTMQMDAGMDTGDVLLSRSASIGATESTEELWDRLAHLGAELIVETLASLSSITPQPQQHEAATYAPLLTKQDGYIDWNQPASAIHNRVRGVTSWPGAWTWWRESRLKLWFVRALNEPTTSPPGTVVRLRPRPVIATAAGCVELIEVQQAGKKRTPAESLVNGARLQIGEQVGAPQSTTTQPNSEH